MLVIKANILKICYLQNALRLLTFRQVNKVLGMELLPVKLQRFTRKRRHEGSAGEGNETEDGMYQIYFNIKIYLVFIIHCILS